MRNSCYLIYVMHNTVYSGTKHLQLPHPYANSSNFSFKQELMHACLSKLEIFAKSFVEALAHTPSK